MRHTYAQRSGLSQGLQSAPLKTPIAILLRALSDPFESIVPISFKSPLLAVLYGRPFGVAGQYECNRWSSEVQFRT